MTVAIIDESTPKIKVSDADLRIEWYSGTGAGGQYRNKHQNSCRITHIPTGIVATSQCRSRQNSYNEARSDIERRVIDLENSALVLNVAVDRRNQVGSGMRGDKIRTYRFQDDRVLDHRSNKSASTKKVLSGNFNLLW